MVVTVNPGDQNYNSKYRFSKSFTFDGTAGNGAQGTVAIATITGLVAIRKPVIICDTDLAGATATISCGVVGSVASPFAAITATTFDAGHVWTPSGASSAKIAAHTAEYVINGANMIFTIATADITGGALTIYFNWDDLSNGASIV